MYFRQDVTSKSLEVQTFGLESSRYNHGDITSQGGSAEYVIQMNYKDNTRLS